MDASGVKEDKKGKKDLFQITFSVMQVYYLEVWEELAEASVKYVRTSLNWN